MDEKQKRLTVRVEDGFLRKLVSVADDLRKCGMTVERCDNATGTITGSMRQEDVEKLRGVAGISSFELP